MLAPNEHIRMRRLRGIIFLLLGFTLIVMFFFFGRTNDEDDIVTVISAPLSVPATDSTSSTQLLSIMNPTTTIVAFGDSITAGYGITLPDAYPAQLERTLRARGFTVKVINSGVSGETTAGGLRRAQFIASQKNDITIIALGGNDVLRGIDPDSTRNNLSQIITIFEKAGSRVVLVGMYAPSNLGDTYVTKFNAIYPALAAEFRVPLAPFLLEGVAFESTFNQNDGIHPNKEGARIIAEQNILPQVVPLLEKIQTGK